MHLPGAGSGFVWLAGGCVGRVEDGREGVAPAIQERVTIVWVLIVRVNNCTQTLECNI